MSTIKEKAEAILQEKEEKIIPTNILDDLTVFGVTGTIHSYNQDEVYERVVDEEEMSIIDNTMVSMQCDVPYDLSWTGGIHLKPDSKVGMRCNFHALATKLNIQPNQIALGENILGVQGSYVGGDWNGIYLSNDGYNYYNTNLEDLHLISTDGKLGVMIKRVYRYVDVESDVEERAMMFNVQVRNSSLYNKKLEEVSISFDVLDENRQKIATIQNEGMDTLDYSGGKYWVNDMYISSDFGSFPETAFTNGRYINNLVITYRIYDEDEL